MRRSQFLQIFSVVVVLSAIGIAIGLSIHWFPSRASKQATDVDNLWNLMLICSVPFAALVLTIVGYSVVKFRMRPGQELEDGPPIHGDTRLEIVWTSVPAILLLTLCTYTYIVLHRIEKAPAAGKPEMVVRVTGQQFTWTYEYPPAPGGGKKLATSQLYLPLGESVKFKIDSVDVVHDFWVPNFRIKLDAVPGISTSYRITPSHLGNYPVVCAELCGLGHATMRSTVHVVTPEKFAAWRARQGGATGGPSAPGGNQPTEDSKRTAGIKVSQ